MKKRAVKTKSRAKYLLTLRVLEDSKTLKVLQVNGDARQRLPKGSYFEESGGFSCACGETGGIQLVLPYPYITPKLYFQSICSACGED